MPAQRDAINFSSVLTLAFSLYRSATEQKKSIHVLLVRSRDEADELSSLIQSFIDADRNELGEAMTLLNWSAWEHSPFSPVSSSITQKIERLRTLDSVKNRKNSLLILSSIDAWIQPTLPEKDYLKSGLVFQINDDAGSRDALKTKLKSLGYVTTEIVQEPG